MSEKAFDNEVYEQQRKNTEARELCEKATPGPWEVKLHNEDYGQGYGETTFFVDIGGMLLKIGIADSAEKYAKYSALGVFFARSHTLIPELCDALERAQAEIEPLTNDALTRDELYHLDGEPLYVMDGEGHECYCVVNTKNKDCIDNEAGAWCFELYDMTGDGKHGLHKMGWRAYRTKPERSEG